MSLMRKLFENKKDWITILANLSTNKQYVTPFLQAIMYHYSDKKPIFEPNPLSYEYYNEGFDFEYTYKPFQRKNNNSSFESSLIVRKRISETNNYLDYPFKAELSIFIKHNDSFTISNTFNGYDTKIIGDFNNKNYCVFSPLKSYHFVEDVNLPLEITTPYFVLFDVVRKDVANLEKVLRII